MLVLAPAFARAERDRTGPSEDCLRLLEVEDNLIHGDFHVDGDGPCGVVVHRLGHVLGLHVLGLTAHADSSGGGRV